MHATGSFCIFAMRVFPFINLVTSNMITLNIKVLDFPRTTIPRNYPIDLPSASSWFERRNKTTIMLPTSSE